MKWAWLERVVIRKRLLYSIPLLHRYETGRRFHYLNSAWMIILEEHIFFHSICNQSPLLIKERLGILNQFIQSTRNYSCWILTTFPFHTKKMRNVLKKKKKMMKTTTGSKKDVRAEGARPLVPTSVTLLRTSPKMMVRLVNGRGTRKERIRA